jgi:hypothetical protein
VGAGSVQILVVFATPTRCAQPYQFILHCDAFISRTMMLWMQMMYSIRRVHKQLLRVNAFSRWVLLCRAE